MERGSDKHGPRVDDQLQREAEPLERAAEQPHREEWRQPEPSGEDEADITHTPGTLRGGTPPGLDPGEVEVRTEIARNLEPAIFPTDRQGVLRNAEANHAPDQVLELLAALPEHERFGTVQDVWSALGGGREERP